MLELTAGAAQQLRDELCVPDLAIEAIRVALPIIGTVCERAALEYSEDEGDDPNLFGQQCSRRARNLIAREIESRHRAGVVARRPRGSLVVIGGETSVYFWAAGDADGSPRLKGGQTKPAILDACLRQLALWESGPVGIPGQLIVAYRATPSASGVAKVVAGVPCAADQWERAVELVDETGMYDAPATVAPIDASERFDATPPLAPVLRLRPREERGES